LPPGECRRRAHQGNQCEGDPIISPSRDDPHPIGKFRRFRWNIIRPIAQSDRCRMIAAATIVAVGPDLA
jgi:hypothetical protein